MSIITGSHPFPYCVIDNFFPTDQLLRAHDSLPPSEEWFKYNNPLERKLALNDVAKFPPGILEVIRFFQSPLALEAIAGTLEVTPDLVGDPSLFGAGIHRIGPGGKLDIHLDHNRNPNLPGLERRVNAIFWFHPKWDKRWGGELELWESKDGKPTKCGVAIEPKPNRLALFKASDISFHGHPDALRCPEGTYRTSLALYFYSKHLEDQKIREKVHFFARPGEPNNPELDSLRALRANPNTSHTVWNSGR